MPKKEQKKKIDYAYALFFNCGTGKVDSTTHVAVRVKGGRKNERTKNMKGHPSFSFKPENELYGDMHCWYVITKKETLEPTNPNNRKLGQILRGCAEIEEWLKNGEVQHWHSHKGSRASELHILSYTEFSDMRHSEIAKKKFVHEEDGKFWIWIENGRQVAWDKVYTLSEGLALHLVDSATRAIDPNCVLSFDIPYDRNEDGMTPPVYRDIDIKKCISESLPKQIIRGGKTIETSNFKTGLRLDVWG